MSKLNAPRTIPYSFKVVAMEGIVWLYDDSERSYLCSSEPTIWAEPLYWLEEPGDELLDSDDIPDLPESNYFSARDIEKLESVKVVKYPADVSKKEAWDDARSEAHANHRI